MSEEFLPSLYLASQSPRRRELLQQIGVSHQVIRADVVEVPRARESASDYVQRLASEKAQAGLANVIQQKLAVKPVLGADTIIVAGDKILEKPTDAGHAACMLRQLSGATHQVMTAVAMCDTSRCVTKLSITDVVFCVLSEPEILTYWETGEPCDKAGGYAIQGLGAVFVQEIRGSYTGVVGLPIELTRALLAEFTVHWWQADC